MKRVATTVLFLVVLTVDPRAVGAQGKTPFEVGTQVIVVASKLAVYTQPDQKSTLVQELASGSIGRILKSQRDLTGGVWLYLTDNGFGWVKSAGSKGQTIVGYSDEALTNLIKAATDAIKAKPQHVESYVVRATSQLQRRQLNAALTDYNAAIERSPKDGWHYELRAYVYLLLHRYEPAIKDLTQAISLNYRFASTYRWLGYAYQAVRRYDDALALYAQALSIAPQYGALFRDRAGVFSARGQLPIAIGELRDAIKHDPLLATAYALRGNLYQQTKRDDLAWQDLNKALEIDVHCAFCYLNRGIFTARVRDDRASALRDFNSAIEKDPTLARAYSNRAAIYLGDEEYGLAASDLRHAASLDPGDDYTFFILGAVYARLGNFDEAEKAYSRCVELDRDYGFTALLYRGQVYVALSRYDEAELDFRVFLDNEPDERFRNVGRLALGAVYLHQRKFPQALSVYKTAFTSKDRDFVKDFSYAGVNYRITGYRDNIIGRMQGKVRENPKDFELIYALAALEMEFGNWQAGTGTFKWYYTSTKKPMPAELKALIELIDGALSANP
jgi:tetratricopeptide (TPR) repeat protein